MKNRFWLLLLTPLLGLPGSGVALEDPHDKCSDSCWIWVTSEEGFAGDDWIICGPAQIRDLSNSERSDSDWDDAIESLHTGATGTVHIWYDENFTGPVTSIKPNQILRSLEQAGANGRDFDGEASSLMVDCPRNESRRLSSGS